MALPNPVIDIFVEHEYPPIVPNFRGIANKVEEICKKALNEANILHVTSSRVKGSESLRAKLKKEQLERGPWKDKKDILQNILDFAGVKLALYRPEEVAMVGRILKNNFVIISDDTKSFGKHLDSDKILAKREPTTAFQPQIQTPKYNATHYIVKLHAKDSHGLHPYQVEVQVMSVLQSAWAQIQHDLTYKQLSGPLSKAELGSLDSLSWAMELGEKFLHQLSKSQDGRKQKATAAFKNIYELGNFLSEWFLDNYKMKVKDLGSLNALKALLEKKEWNSRQALSTILEELHPNSENSMDAAQKRFPNIELRPTVFIIDYIVFKHSQHGNVNSWDRHREEMRYKAKLEIIMSTILWLSDFFRPSDWEDALRSEGSPTQNKIRIDRLSWFASPRPEELIYYDEFRTSPDDREHVEQLWGWFDNHHSHAIQLAFHISKYVQRRDLTQEVVQFTRVFAKLGSELQKEYREHY